MKKLTSRRISVGNPSGAASAVLFFGLEETDTQPNWVKWLVKRRIKTGKPLCKKYCRKEIRKFSSFNPNDFNGIVDNLESAFRDISIEELLTCKSSTIKKAAVLYSKRGKV
jgi:hypothetical protein